MPVQSLDARVGSSGLPGAAAIRRAGARLGIDTVRDLLFHLPRGYADLRQSSTAAQLRDLDDGTAATARLEVATVRLDQTFRRRVQRTVAVLRDPTGEVEAVWFGRRFIERRLKEGAWVVVSGRVRHRGWRTTLENPEFQADDGSELVHAGRIVPVYRLSEGLTARTLRNAMRAALTAHHDYPEYLPRSVRGDRPGIADALEQAHFPVDFPPRDRALDRLALDELLALQVGMVSRRRARGSDSATPVTVDELRFHTAVASVEGTIDASIGARKRAADEPWEAGTIGLTPDQRHALDAIRADLTQTRPMLRLLQGDVGSGKTAVAALAMAFVADAGGQAALLAPTDLLARQHAATLGQLLAPLAHEVTLVSGSQSTAERREAERLLAAPVASTLSGATSGQVVVGTHALLQETTGFADLRLAIVDEQHRFGVAQRDALAAKGAVPHVLLMTATPIPRTMAQVLYADLDVSDLHTAPTGRRPVVTGVRQPDELLRSAGDRPGALPLIVTEVAAGRRAFVIVPLVHDDEESGATSVEGAQRLLDASWAEAASIAGHPGLVLRIEVVHGQMKPAERDERMARFRVGEADVLVGTTVLEVGVDVPEATVMLVLDADRFGVAQLHQLRGRVGRGEAQSYCVLVSARYPRRDGRDAQLTDEQRLIRARLDAVAAQTDGFVLAELDWELRGEGQLLGLQQSGLPPLRVASLGRTDHRMLATEARELAERLVDEQGRLRPGLERLELELTRGWLRRIGAGELVGPGELDA
jgi:ATP-dependent DNA helicase RecG